MFVWVLWVLEYIFVIMKKMKILLYLLTMVSLAIIGCQERGMGNRIRYTYSFLIVDSANNNLVGDTTYRKRYYLDSIKFYSADGSNILSTNFPQTIYGNGLSGYIYKANAQSNFNQKFIIRYNPMALEDDTIYVVYGKDNIIVNRNNQLIFNKNNISQSTDITFQIIK